jgi:hypothetical protein
VRRQIHALDGFKHLGNFVLRGMALHHDEHRDSVMGSGINFRSYRNFPSLRIHLPRYQAGGYAAKPLGRLFRVAAISWDCYL